MILNLDPQDAVALLAFLRDANHLRMQKRDHAALARFKADVVRFQVNSQRLEHVMPVLRQAHTAFRTMAARNLRYSQIARWQRVLVIPALFKYLLRVRPARRKYDGQLDNVALIVKRMQDQAKPLIVHAAQPEGSAS